MRIPLLNPEALDADQTALYEDMVDEIKRDFKGFTAIDERTGSLLGPFNVWMSEPRWGRAIWDLIKTMSVSTLLPREVREVAILVTGAHFRSAYQIYAHVVLAENRGLDDAKIATIVAGQRPSNLSDPEAIAYDVAAALVDGHVLPALTYKRAVDTFGAKAAKELIYLVGVYCFVSVSLNGFDIQVPEDGLT